MPNVTVTCPECGFSREVDESKIPRGSLTVTCPSCHHAFSFSLPEQAPLAPPGSRSAVRFHPRDLIVTWTEQGHIPPEQFGPAIRCAGLRPDPDAWHRFVQLLLLAGGVLGTTIGVIFFIAFNWSDLGRLAKIGLVELLLCAALIPALKARPGSITARGSLSGIAILIGGLFALVGQIYQTGADPWQLFAIWGVALFPLAAVSRFPALWGMLFALVNTAGLLYFQIRPGFWGGIRLATGSDAPVWFLFHVNLLALIGWECGIRLGHAWMEERWLPHLLALVCGGSITWLAVIGISKRHFSSEGAVIIFILWSVALYRYYRRLQGDLFMLAGGVLSGIVVITAFLIRHLMEHGDAGGFLFISMVVISLTAVGGGWLRRVAKEVQQ